MPSEVVCISRTIAARGEGIGQLVAERLGFRYVDEQIIARAAQLAQVDPTLVAAAEQRQPLLQRIVDKLAAAQEMIGPMALAAGLPVTGVGAVSTRYKASPEDMRALIRAAVLEVGKARRVVIVAHAASMALAFVEGVLRVLVTASVETRTRRLAATEGMGQTDAAQAIAESDRHRQDYFRRFYKVSEELPTHYDLVINTDVLTPEQAGEIITLAARGAA